MAEIYRIVYQPMDEHYPEGHSGDFIRRPLQTAELIAGYGLKGDAKAGRRSDRQVNILSTDWLEKRRQEGFRTNPGDFGEQLTVDGLDVLSLEPGTQLQLGPAVVEIVKARAGCLRLAAAHGYDEVLDVGGVGVMARVLVSGTIRVGDPVVVLSEELVLA
jgi:MOSC domain-containing protein YiiM